MGIHEQRRRSGAVRAAVAAAILAAVPAAAYADAAEPEAAEAGAPLTLEQRLEAAEQRIRVLERRLELQTEDTARVAAEAPQVRAGPKGFSLATRDGANSLRLRAVLNVDGRRFGNDDVAPGSDTWLLRQARPIFEGTIGGIFDFRLMPDFAGGRTVIQDAYVTGRFHPAAAVTVGKFKVPFGLERLQSDTDIKFIERGLPNNLVPNRDVGIQLAGDFYAGRLSYQLAAQNGVADGGSSDAIGDVDNNNDQEFAARVFTQPFLQSDVYALRGLGFGIAASYADSEGAAGRTLLPTYRSNGQQAIFAYRGGATPTLANGERLRLSPQFHWYTGSFGVLGEYVRVDQNVARTLASGVRREDKLKHEAWQVAASWYLTGEDAGFRSAAPKASYAKGAGWGALELVARYGVLDLDAATFAGGANSFADPATSVRRASAWAVGANWYLTPNVKTVLDFEHTSFDGGAAAGADRPDERALFTRFQVGF